MRRLETISSKTTGREARIYRDSEWQEWRVCFYQDGRHLLNADFHTDDKGDAQHTARAWVWGKQSPAAANPDAWIDQALMQSHDDHFCCDDF